MQISFTEKKNIRKSFGKLKESLSIPNLIEVQKNSYKELTDFDLREKMYHEKMKEIDESFLPIGFIDDGTEPETFVDNQGTQWKTARADRMLEESGHNVFGV